MRQTCASVFHRWRSSNLKCHWTQGSWLYQTTLTIKALVPPMRVRVRVRVRASVRVRARIGVRVMARGSGRVRITSLESPRMVIRELYWDLQS